jgi:DNA-directed RNA polymerase sigma subunit (sigma70/sigma32)
MTHAHPGAELATLSVGSLVWMASAQPVLDELTEDELIQAAREGKRDALEELAVRNLRVVVDEAIRCRGLGTPQGRLVRAGVAALLEAVRVYDPSAHGRCSEHIRSSVREALQRKIGLS